MNIGIVGAGVLGLAAARKFQQAGHQVTIFESRDDVGGQVVTFEIGGERIECFYHHLFTNDTVAVRYIEDMGLGDRLRWIEPSNAILRNGRIFPFVSPLDLLRYTAVPLAGRIRLGLAAVWLRRQKDYKKYEQVTARHWMERAVGRRAFEGVWGPLLRGKFADQADNVGMTWLWGKIYLRFASRSGAGGHKEQLGYLEGSFNTYIERIAERVREAGGTIRLETLVDEVTISAGRVSGIRAGGVDHAFDAVLMTTPNIVTRKIAPQLPVPYQEQLDKVRYQWATCLVLALDRKLSDVYWLSVADDLPFVAVVEHTNFIPASRYGGNHIVYLSNYVSPGDPVLGMDAGEVFEHYLAGLKAVNPVFDRSWVREMWLFKDPGGQPVITTNYASTIPDMRTGVDGLYLANTTQVYPEDRGQNYSLRLGERVAELMMKDAATSA
ncbi:MAG: NAD(P)/FAD-dependent oxidoreductase [Dehalococcoidia bacterium]|nr:NAD(P)/FAD-dependent oxidoreductase [Dehalococcoidia bacterium]MCB9486717.1 NAD(P)/FAD-dependent oxidoreductase [Thermoflexaceae bacterium]